MVPADLHDFFVASASAAGALIGLLFVALSVWREREDEERHVSEFHRLRAAAALTVFTNALTISLFSLIPGETIGETAVIVASLGVIYVLGSTLRLVRLHRAHVRLRVRDAVFLVGGAALFVFELLDGIALWSHPGRVERVRDLASLVALSLLYGIARSWELIGGPRVGVAGEVSAMLHGRPVVPAEGADGAEEEAEAG